jgi:midasin
MTTLRGAAWAGQALKGRKIDGPGDVCKLPENFRKACFQEAFDLFAVSLNNESDKELLLLHLVRLWGLPDDNVHYFLNLHSPRVLFSANSGECEIGRSTLQKHHMAAYEEQRDSLPASSEYTLTGSSTRLLERVAVALQVEEPVLLVGETGVGKTSAVQALSKDLGAPLRVVNLSHQTDSADLLGGFKPVEPKSRVHDLIKKVTPLVHSTWPHGDNTKFVKSLLRYCHEKKYRKVLKAVKSANSRVEMSREFLEFSTKGAASAKDIKDLPTLGGHVQELLPGWAQAMAETQALELLLSSDSAFCFAYVPGALAEAITEGHWVLLDEINLAPHETLQRLSGLLDSPEGSVTLTERGDLEPLQRHPQFRMFAAMNPATDTGKSDLPPALRGRFTEIYVSDELPREDLERIASSALAEVAPDPPVAGVVDFYTEVRRLALKDLEDGAGQRPCYSLRSLSRLLRYARKMAPTYGLSRALFDGALVSFATQLSVDSRKAVTELAKKILPGQHTSRITAPGLAPGRKAVEFEGFWIDAGEFEEHTKAQDGRFVTTPTVRIRLQDVARAVSYNSSPILLQGPTSAGKTSLVAHLASKAGYRCIRINNHEHTDIQEYMGSYTSAEDGRICFKEGLLVQALRRGYWVVLDELNLAPTEVLEALNRLLDDNQELYVPELNETVRPAPGFMLFATQNPPGPYSGRKALSRALRNRFIELQIDDLPPEEVTSMLEARCEIPKSYATKMVQVMRDLQRVRSASAVFVGKGGLVTPRDLFRWAARGGSGYQHLAEDGFLLLGERLRNDGERGTVREILERVMKVHLDMTSVYDLDAGEAQGRIKKLRESPGVTDISALTAIVWGPTMRYLYTVTARAVLHQEPLLLIGETGCGKTTVCQTISAIRQQKLHIINCHQHSEASDFLGGFRPSRHRNKGRQMAIAAAAALLGMPAFSTRASSGLADLFAKIAAAESHSAAGEDAKNFMQAVKMAWKELPQLVDGAGPEAMDTENGSLTEVQTQLEMLKKGCQLFTSPFEWSDGPLVQAMQNGDAILIDEINLAADAVIERLNSVLEPERTLTLSERGGSDNCEIVAHPEFRLFATMNPGLDFGKRELSPALRSRFTECWIPSALEDPEELRALVGGRLDPSIEKDDKQLVCDAVLSFWLAFRKAVAVSTGDASLATSFSGFSFSVRDILSWVQFINDSLARQLCGAKEAIAHGAYLTVIDTIGVGSSSGKVQHLRGVCAAELAAILQWSVPHLEAVAGCGSECPRYLSENLWGIPPFTLKIEDVSPEDEGSSGGFQMEAPTVRKNVLRILRALHLHRAIMLEGSPGVGKSSIVSALAKKAGKFLVRINFSEQTDMADLVGNDLPSEAGGFAWNDGPLLTAIKQGSWVLLDELNLASQSVLEGLNSLLDHREEIFIPELGRKFPCSPGFQVFAAQNPLSQGGGRKGLPRSFMNRFTRVQVEALSVDDLHAILMNAMSPKDIAVPEQMLRGMVAFVSELRELTGPFGSLARKGAPWDFNLRDLLRWYSFFQEGLSLSDEPATAPWCQAAASHAYGLAFRERLRTEVDKEEADILFAKHLLFRPSPAGVWLPTAGPGRAHGIVPYAVSLGRSSAHAWQLGHHVAREHLGALEATMYSAKMGWPTLLVGPSATLRDSLVQATAAACSVPGCVKISCGPNMDASDLLGGFEQEAHARRRSVAAQQLHVAAQECTRTFLLRGSAYTEMSQAWEHARQACERAESSQSEQIGLSEKKTLLLEALNRVRTALGVGGRDTAAEDAVHCAESVLYSEKDTIIRWQDGPLLRALKDGLWLVLENANLCSPSVLDRLNPLLEPGGQLLVNEAGGGEDLHGDAQNHVIKPHENFRIFLSYDSFLGEISRAMRNRCLEVHVSPPAAHANDIAAMGEPHGLGTPAPDEVRMMASAYSSHRSDSYEGARRMCSAYACSMDVLLAAGLPLERGAALAFEYSVATSDPFSSPGDVSHAFLAYSSGGWHHDTFEAGLGGLAHNLTGLVSVGMGRAAFPEPRSSACAVAASYEVGCLPLERLYSVNRFAHAVEGSLSDEKMQKFSVDCLLAGADVRSSLQKKLCSSRHRRPLERDLC